jgi:serine protease SohB
MDAHEVNSLREEITAVLAAAKARDQVVIRLESPGGVVHGYGWQPLSCSACATSRSR